MELNLDTNEYLKRFRVFKNPALFQLSRAEFTYWVSRNKCPHCIRKLYIRKDKKIAFCKSKAKDGFKITGQRLLELGGSLAP